MNDVEPETLDWLRPGIFPLGKLSLISGVPGLGKSFLTMDMAARVSRGSPWPESPEFENVAGNVLIMSGEDGLADTICNRLKACGADRTRIHAMQGVQREKGEPHTLVELDRDMQHLRAMVEQINPRLAVVDPITCFLGDTDSHRDAAMRGVLAPLADLADTSRCSILVVNHLNKNRGLLAVERVGGSIAMAGAARAAWMVTEDPEDSKRRLFLPIKMNLAKNKGGLAFSIVDSDVDAGDGEMVGRVHWHEGRVELTANDALAPEIERKEKPDYVREWLSNRLALGPVAQSELKDEAVNGEGFGWRTVTTAKGELKVVATKKGFGEDGVWWWHLPGAEISRKLSAKDA